ncbi:hypothetical protein OH781_39945 [Streptomyces sp. NBC_01550]|uniref:effector-associated constant component EACC1 n=1 Tax=Streptomyces sp. NBC_01550 TaxID=2975875 RepID=UPI003869ED6A
MSEVRGSTPRPGETRTVLDVLQLVTGNGWSAASFVLALVAWRQTRPQQPWVEIRHGDKVIVLTDCSSEEIERATRWDEAVTRVVDEQRVSGLGQPPARCPCACRPERDHC